MTRAHRFQDARRILEQVTEPEDRPRRIALHRVKAAVASGLSENETAANEMRLALALQPNDGGLLIATAAAELAAGQLDEALKHARAAPESAQVMALLADIQEKRGAYVEAANAYRRAIELAPDREEYRIAFALELVQHQTFQPAIEVLEQAANLFPRSARIRTLLGVAQYALGNRDRAMSALVEALDRDPTLEPAFQYLADIALESSSSPPQNVYTTLCRRDAAVCGAMKLRRSREQDNPQLRAEALAALKQAQCTSAVCRCELGRAYEWSGDWQQARPQMEACVALQPSAENHYRLGLIYRELGEIELSRKQMQARSESLRKASDEGARRLKTVQAFESVKR